MVRGRLLGVSAVARTRTSHPLGAGLLLSRVRALMVRFCSCGWLRSYRGPLCAGGVEPAAWRRRPRPSLACRCVPGWSRAALWTGHPGGACPDTRAGRAWVDRMGWEPGARAVIGRVRCTRDTLGLTLAGRRVRWRGRWSRPERSTTVPASAKTAARNPFHLGSATHSVGGSGLSTATVSIGSGRDHITGQAFHHTSWALPDESDFHPLLKWEIRFSVVTKVSPDVMGWCAGHGGTSRGPRDGDGARATAGAHL